MKFLVHLCVLAVILAACDINDFECDNDIQFPDVSDKFFVTSSLPSQDEMNVLLDSKITLQFNGIISRSTPKNGFFFLLNQKTGSRTELTPNCISQPGDFTLIFDVVRCIGDVMDENTDYMFFISQKLESGELITFSSQRNIPVEALAFSRSRSSLHFRTISHIPADVVPSKCSPAFSASDVSLHPTIVIAFSSEIHLGSGLLTISSTQHPSTTVKYDVSDSTHVAISDDLLSLLVFDIRLNGDDQYHVTFPEGLVRSASGSNCGTTDDFKFSTAKDEEPPFIVSIVPSNYQANLPSNTRIRITFSEPVVGSGGFIHFKSSQQTDFRVSTTSSSEVSCVRETCSIFPSSGFSAGTYEMSFDKNVFKDTSSNVLKEGVSAHVFTIGSTTCGLGYVQVGDNEDCKCASVGETCQCVCGETTFVKGL